MTYCKQEYSLQGNITTLHTLRKGFPGNRVVLTDNASYPGAREIFKRMCQENDFEYRQLDIEIAHSTFLYQTIKQACGPIVILDPDVIFWDSCEGFINKLSPGILLKGRHIPNFRIVTGPSRVVLFAERIHTSFMVIPDPVALQEIILSWAKRKVYLFDFRPGHDTGSLLFSKAKEKILPFTADELDCYDHVFVGTQTAEQLSSPCARIILEEFKEIYSIIKHAKNADDYSEIKGAWRVQEEFFKSNTFEFPEYPLLYNNAGFDMFCSSRGSSAPDLWADVEIEQEPLNMQMLIQQSIYEEAYKRMWLNRE
jgi:hypothetical protein